MPHPEPPSPSRDAEGLLVDETLRVVASGAAASGAEDGLRDGDPPALGALPGEGVLVDEGALVASLVPIPLVSLNDIDAMLKREVGGR